MRKDLLNGVMVRHVQLEISLEFQILEEVLELGLAQLFIHWHLLCLLVYVLLEVSLNHFPKLSDQLQNTDLQKAVKESFIPLEKSNNQVLIDEIVECLLLYCAFCDFFRLKFVIEDMGHLL